MNAMGHPPAPTANDATRVLCSAVIARPAFGDLVYRVLCVPRIRTMAPSPGVDLVTLARHAAWTVRQRQVRHVVLSSALVLVVVSVPIPQVGGPLAVGSMLGATLWALCHQVHAARIATRIFDVGVDPGLGCGLLDDAQEQHLAAVNDANLLIYAPALDDNPFPGSGQRVNARLSRTFDIAKAKDDTKPAQAFTPSDLLEHLARQLPHHIALTNVVESRRARMVLYARGTAVDQVPGFLPDPLGQPVVKAPGTLLQQVADDPGQDLRTYLRAQVVGHDGHVVTTFHLTAVTSPMGLSLDFTLHVLRPIHPEYYAADRLPRTTGLLGAHLLLQGSLLRSWLVATVAATGAVLESGVIVGVRTYVRRLFQDRERSLLAAPVRALQGLLLLRKARSTAQLTAGQQRAVGAQDFYGTHAGIREATSHNTEFGHNERNDANRHFNEVLTAVLRELVSFLESRNIDPYELLQERASIIQTFTTEFHQTINGAYHAGINAGGSITVGGNVHANAQNFPNLHRQTPVSQPPTP